MFSQKDQGLGIFGTTHATSGIKYATILLYFYTYNSTAVQLLTNEYHVLLNKALNVSP